MIRVTIQGTAGEGKSVLAAMFAAGCRAYGIPFKIQDGEPGPGDAQDLLSEPKAPVDEWIKMPRMLVAVAETMRNKGEAVQITTIQVNRPARGDGAV